MQELNDFKCNFDTDSDTAWYKSLGSPNKSCALRRLASFICGDLLGYMTLESRGEIKNRRCIQKVKTSVPKGYRPHNVTINSLGCVNVSKEVRKFTREFSTLINRDKET